jgi:magnesium-transporting ATPase (P-type)
VTASEDILSLTMRKNINGMIIYISIVMFVMFWFNEKFWGFTYSMEEDMFNSTDPTNKCRAFTMLFNIFIWMHLFNLINCRHLTEKGLVPY